MTPIGWAKYVRLTRFSKPKCSRSIYRYIKEHRVHRIVEIGLQSVEFTTNLLEIALRYQTEEKIHYAGIDLFEARPENQDRFSLKSMHRSLATDQIKVRLIPGDPMVGLSRFANTLVGTELLVISDQVDEEAMSEAWYYVPRTLKDDAAVFQFLRVNDTLRVNRLTKTEIASMVAKQKRRSAA